MKILNNKRGIVLENAIVFMLVIFSLCFLLTSLTLISYHQTRIDLTKIENKIKIDQIGEDFLTEIAANGTFIRTYDNYEYSVVEPSNDAPYYTLKVTQRDTGIEKLHIEAKLINGQMQVTRWEYK